MTSWLGRTAAIRICMQGLLAASFLALAACSKPATPAQPTTATAPDATLATTSPTAKDAVKPAKEAVDTQPEQLPDAEDTDEAVGEIAKPSAVTPEFKLAATPATEPKPAPSSFKEGVNYTRLVPVQPTATEPEHVEVLEFFWYGCPHCFALDPKLEAWLAHDKPAYVAFRRVPVMWGDAQRFHARVFYTAEQLGKLAQLHTQIFREIHVNGDPLITMDKAKSFFVAQGIAPADFDRAFNSSDVQRKLDAAEVLNRRYRVQSVPLFVVNGKFTADVGTAGGEEQLLQLIGELAAREHRG